MLQEVLRKEFINWLLNCSISFAYGPHCGCYPGVVETFEGVRNSALNAEDEMFLSRLLGDFYQYSESGWMPAPDIAKRIQECAS